MRRRRAKLSPAQRRILDKADRISLYADVLRTGIAQGLMRISDAVAIARLVDIAQADLVTKAKLAQSLYDRVWSRRVKTPRHRKPRRPKQAKAVTRRS